MFCVSSSPLLRWGQHTGTPIVLHRMDRLFQRLLDMFQHVFTMDSCPSHVATSISCTSVELPNLGDRFAMAPPPLLLTHVGGLPLNKDTWFSRIPRVSTRPRSVYLAPLMINVFFHFLSPAFSDHCFVPVLPVSTSPIDLIYSSKSACKEVWRLVSYFDNRAVTPS